MDKQYRLENLRMNYGKNEALFNLIYIIRKSKKKRFMARPVKIHKFQTMQVPKSCKKWRQRRRTWMRYASQILATSLLQKLRPSQESVQRHPKLTTISPLHTTIFFLFSNQIIDVERVV